MIRLLSLLLLPGLLLACAPEPPEEVQPAPAATAPVRRPPPVRAAVAPRPLLATPPVEAPQPPAAAAPASPAIWHVSRDGVVGCADRAALQVLSQRAADGAPRLLAEARSAGGCRTTFRVNEWVLEAAEGEAVRLRMTNGGPLTLWFQRSEVSPP